MQEKNPNPSQQKQGLQPERRPDDNPEPRKDFPGKAPDVYSDKSKQGQRPERDPSENKNPGQSPGKSDKGDRDRSGQTPGGGGRDQSH